MASVTCMPQECGSVASVVGSVGRRYRLGSASRCCCPGCNATSCDLRHASNEARRMLTCEIGKAHGTGENDATHTPGSTDQYAQRVACRHRVRHGMPRYQLPGAYSGPDQCADAERSGPAPGDDVKDQRLRRGAVRGAEVHGCEYYSRVE